MSTTSNTKPCGCCEGVEAGTPEALANRPGLSALRYRVGTYGTFTQAMQVALRGTSALRDLTSERDDPAVALLDAWAVVLDVLTFYQERIASENYLRTATERRSVLALARQIGYELRPGVAAGTVLAFTLEDAPGAPRAARVPVGTRAQSVPGQDEKPQSFETVEEIHADAAWNSMRARQHVAYTPGMNSRTVYLAGVTTNLQPGDTLLLVGDERARDAGNENWDVRRVKTITPNRERGVTTVTFDRGLGTHLPRVSPAAAPVVYALRTRASAFGYNAPEWRTMPAVVKRAHLGLGDTATIPSHADWPGLNLTSISNDRMGRTVFLDRLYKEIVPDSWVAVTTGDYAEVYRVDRTAEDSRTGFTLASKTTRLTLDGEGLLLRFDNDVRDLVVHAASEVLVQTDRPLYTPVEGREVYLDVTTEGIEEGRLIAVSGLDAITAEARVEVAEVLRTDAVEGTTRLTFVANLAYTYTRESALFNANVARATHGESRAEVVGSGSGSAPFQEFTLRNNPLTYISAPTASGVESTLDVRVDGILWAEVPTLYSQPADAQVYATRLAEDGTVTVQFGDGESGARLPTGVENVRAAYRIGTGLEGIVKAGQIKLLTTRPLGVKSVVNPLPSGGADEPEALDDARDNAPLTVLTLDRAVSLRDVQDFSRSFPGVAKAQVERLWDGETRFVYVTVAAADEQPLVASSALYQNLRDALLSAWHGAERIEIATYDARTFGLEAGLTIDTRYVSKDVLEGAHLSLQKAFSFEERALGQGVTAGEVMAVLQGVDGVVAVDLDTLDRRDALRFSRVLALRARRERNRVRPAQLLTLIPAAATLFEVMA